MIEVIPKGWAYKDYAGRKGQDANNIVPMAEKAKRTRRWKETWEGDDEEQSI